MSDGIRLERHGHILTIGLDRPDARNLINTAMMRSLSAAYATLCDEPALRCGLLYSTSDIFAAGLDLIDMAPVLADQPKSQGVVFTQEHEVDPFNWASASGKVGRRRTKPVVSAVDGLCFTAGIELLLATDIVVAGEDARFAQSEVRAGLMPLGGAIEGLVARAGWGSAMRYLLTGDAFDAHEAQRLGLVQDVTPAGGAFARAMQIAERIVTAAPLGVQGVLENAYRARDEGALGAAEHIRPYGVSRISPSKDLQEGVAAVIEKRDPAFIGA